jgi:hypothetical protein
MIYYKNYLAQIEWFVIVSYFKFVKNLKIAIKIKQCVSAGHPDIIMELKVQVIILCLLVYNVAFSLSNNE